jgi:hypothetical protein
MKLYRRSRYTVRRSTNNTALSPDQFDGRQDKHRNQGVGGWRLIRIAVGYNRAAKQAEELALRARADSVEAARMRIVREH